MSAHNLVSSVAEQTILRPRLRLLILTESPLRSRELAHLLEPLGCDITLLVCSSTEDGPISESAYDLIVADIARHDPSLLHHLRSQVTLPIVALVPEQFSPSVIERVQADHCRFVFVSAHPQEILQIVRDQLEIVALRRATSWLTDQLRGRYHPDNIIGMSRGAHNRRAFVRAFADVDLPVLLVGERGVGKGMIARTLHYTSRRAALPFLVVDTEALPVGGLEALLLGETTRFDPRTPTFHPGLVELARGGTLYLTEIARIPLIVQIRLAALLQEQQNDVERPRLRTRLVFGSQASADHLRRQRLLDDDLFSALEATQLIIEPLRQRPEDIPLFVEAFISEICREYNKEPRDITPAALEALTRYSWPGNVSELKRTILAAVERTRPPAIDETTLPEPIGTKPSLLPKVAVTEAGLDFYDVVEEFERALVSSALQLTSGNQRRAARLLHLKETTLAAMRKRLFRKPAAPK